jgi:hypothetical protein
MAVGSRQPGGPDHGGNPPNTLTALRTGTVAVGRFGEPSAWRVDKLVTASCTGRPTRG